MGVGVMEYYLFAVTLILYFIQEHQFHWCSFFFLNIYVVMIAFEVFIYLVNIAKG